MNEVNNEKSIERILQDVDKLTLPELDKLIADFKERHNLKEESIMQTAANNVNSSQPQEEKKLSLAIKKLGATPMQTYKLLVSNKIAKNLLEANSLLKQLPYTVLKDSSEKEVQALKSELEKQGAEVEIK